MFLCISPNIYFLYSPSTQHPPHTSSLGCTLAPHLQVSFEPDLTCTFTHKTSRPSQSRQISLFPLPFRAYCFLLSITSRSSLPTAIQSSFPPPSLSHLERSRECCKLFFQFSRSVMLNMVPAGRMKLLTTRNTLVWIVMCWRCKVHTGFWRLNMKREYKTFH